MKRRVERLEARKGVGVLSISAALEEAVRDPEHDRPLTDEELRELEAYDPADQSFEARLSLVLAKAERDRRASL